MAVTQKQIAQLLDLSQPQVAQALNGQPGVSATTRQRVLETAESLGYTLKSNNTARQMAALRHGKRIRTGTVAVLMGDFFEGLPLPQLPFFREILQGLHREIELYDGHLATYYIARSGRLPGAILSGGVDGIICLYSATTEWELDKVQVDVPVVRLGGATPKWNLRPNDYQGMYDVTRHLLDLGHRRIAFLGDLQRKFAIFSHDERLRGFQDALQDSGVEIDDDLLFNLDDPSSHDGFIAIQEALRRGLEFSALVCLNDLSALGAISAAQQYGLRVPLDLSVTGFDGLQSEPSSAVSLLASPSPAIELTSVFFDRDLMGRKAVRMIYDAPLQETPDSATNREILPVQLLIKRTTAPVSQTKRKETKRVLVA
jgi:LacI family transcriptional regulator